jgi:hypothetical protein
MGIRVSVTLSSSGIGRAVDLDWMSSKFAAYAVTFSSSGIATWTVEGTLDDLQRVSSPVWFTLSSGNANSSYSLASGPLAGIRPNVASLSSATLTFRVLQGVGQRATRTSSAKAAKPGRVSRAATRRRLTTGCGSATR